MSPPISADMLRSTTPTHSRNKAMITAMLKAEYPTVFILDFFQFTFIILVMCGNESTDIFSNCKFVNHKIFYLPHVCCKFTFLY